MYQQHRILPPSTNTGQVHFARIDICSAVQDLIRNNPKLTHLLEPLHVVVDYEGPTHALRQAMEYANENLQDLVAHVGDEKSDHIKRQQLIDLGRISKAPYQPPRGERNAPQKIACPVTQWLGHIYVYIYIYIIF